ncbi:ATP-binding cassette domain-containing protein, partial [Acidianus sp. RZ1]|uniref:ATP-binding cassette domain-containing protein n=1 Tax=Acidianus sp. RZ1 TaxID=1540082 RepID=UPI00149148D2
VVDFLTDLVSIMYGEGGVYGKVSKTYSSRVGINNFLDGFLPAENIKFRESNIKFNIRELSDLDLAKNVNTRVRWSKIVKDLEGFKLIVEEGEAREGEVIGILGQNGIGKTTFARILVNEIKPEYGEISPPGLTLSYKPQKLVADYDINVQEFLENFRKDILSTSSWFFEEVIRKLGIHRFLESKVKELSGGELQKVYVAASLSREADIYVLDEPSSYLDIEERYVVSKAIKRITRERKSVTFLIDHDLAIHDYISDRIMVFTGKPGIEGIGNAPTTLKRGMNEFLKVVGITFRRDSDSGRPRVNKLDSFLDRIQKQKNEYYSME